MRSGVFKGFLRTGVMFFLTITIDIVRAEEFARAWLQFWQKAIHVSSLRNFISALFVETNKIAFLEISKSQIQLPAALLIV